MQWSLVPLFCFWLAFSSAIAYMQGTLMPAIRRTPPGEEAKRQDFALHKVGVLVYVLPAVAVTTLGGTIYIAPTLVLLAIARIVTFDPVLNWAGGSPVFYVGRTARLDLLLWKLGNASMLSATLRALAFVVGLAYLFFASPVAGH